MSAALLAAAFVLPLAALLAGRVALVRVPEGQVLAVRRLGRRERVLTPGLRLRLPFVDRVVRRVNLAGHSLSLERRLLACRDLRAVAVDGLVYFQFLDPLEAARRGTQAHERIAAELARSLAALAHASPSDELCAQPAESFAAALKSRLNGILGEQGLMITRLQLRLAPMPAP